MTILKRTVRSMQQNQTKSYQILLCAELNNLSISLVENQQYDLAIESLKQVVHTLKSSMSGSSSNGNNDEAVCRLSYKNNILSIIQQDPVIKLARSRLQNFNTDDDNSTICAGSSNNISDNKNHMSTTRTTTSSPKFHFRPPQRIQVARYLNDICANNEVTVSKMFDIVSATVLFNLGVAHHIKEYSCHQQQQQQECQYNHLQSPSISMSSSSSSSMRSKALDFYNISWSILLQAANESLLENPLHGELSILVLNNLCHLYRERRQYDIARDCLRQLGTMIIQKNYSINLDGLEEAIGKSLAPAA